MSEHKEEAFDVIVVGGGIMGSCTAYEISKRGYSTLLLDQFDFLHCRGSSHGESRTLRTTYPEPYYRPLVLESSHLWEQAQSEVGYRVLYPSNQLDIGPSDDASLQAVVASSGSCRVLDPFQLTQEFSGRVVVPQGWIGVVSDGAAVIKPTKAVSMFQALALRNGTVLRDNMQVTAITRKEGSILVSTATGDHFCGKKCVVTAGAWMTKLVRAITGRDIPIQPLETTLCYWKIKEGHEQDYSLQGGFPTFAGYGRPYYIYGTPALEYPGLIKAAVHGGRACDPDKRTWAPQPEMMDYLKEWVRDRFGGLVEHNKPVSSQSCMYSVTPDDDYVIDFLGGEFGKDVVLAGGFSGHGFKMGPAIGRVVADLVLHGDAQGVDLDYFKLDRFDKNPKGNVKGFVCTTSEASHSKVSHPD